MELLFDGMARMKQKFQDENGEYKDIHKWHIPFQAYIQTRDERVVGVKLRLCVYYEVQYPFECIPQLVEKFCVTESNLFGSMDTAALPTKLIVFSVSKNSLFGEVNLASFPRQLVKIRINGNAFCGSLALYDLPPSLQEFIAGQNRFCGDLSLDNMPETLVSLRLQENSLTGAIVIEKLPQALQTIDLSFNAFEGDFRIEVVPRCLKEIRIMGNPLNSTAVIAEAVPIPFTLSHDSIESVVDANGQAYIWQDLIVRNKP